MGKKGVIMPCCCWYDPPEESKKLIKDKCQDIVNELHKITKIGDPFGWELKDVHKLLDHLYNPSTCEEKHD